MLIFFSIIATALLIKFRLPIAKKLKIIDYPTEKRKIHKLPTPLMGGLIIIINLLLINAYLFLKNELSSLDITIFIFCFFSFIIGLIDDQKKISSVNKLMIIGLVYVIIGVIDKNLFLKYLYLETLDKFFYLNVFNIFFSTLCVLLLINAFNLVDGLNGLAISIENWNADRKPNLFSEEISVEDAKFGIENENELIIWLPIQTTENFSLAVDTV